MAAFGVDMEDATGLRSLEITVRQLLQGVGDTVMLSGSEAYNEALIYYNAVKRAASEDIPGAKAEYEEMKNRFPGRKKTA